MPSSWTPPRRHLSRAPLGAALCVVLALTAVPVTAAPIHPLSEANPLTALRLTDADPESSVAMALPAYAEAPKVGPRRDAQPPFLAWPAPGPLESPYGFRWGRVHEGLDIDGETGDPVTSAERGTVTLAEWDEGYGLTVEVVHDGRFAGLSTRYSHLSSIAVGVGEYVARGEQVGRIGTTGFVTGSHLHFELHDADGPFDPQQLLLSRGDS